MAQTICGATFCDGRAAAFGVSPVGIAPVAIIYRATVHPQRVLVPPTQGSRTIALPLTLEDNREVSLPSGGHSAQ